MFLASLEARSTINFVVIAALFRTFVGLLRFMLCIF